MKEKQIKIKMWVIFPEFGMNAVPYIFDATNEDVSDKEISLNVEEQFYGEKLK